MWPVKKKYQWERFVGDGEERRGEERRGEERRRGEVDGYPASKLDFRLNEGEMELTCMLLTTWAHFWPETLYTNAICTALKHGP